MIRFADGTELQTTEVLAGLRDMRGATRESLAMRVSGDCASLAALFVDGARFSLVEAKTEGGEAVYDKSGYSLAGDLIDHRDGTVTVIVGRPTEGERAQGAARALLAAVPLSGAPLPVLNEAVTLLPVWGPGAYQRGDVRREGDVPYWALHDHDSTATPEQTPAATPSMWAHYHGTSPETARPFVAESHNMYMVGHYCVEDGAVYRCVQDNTVYAPSVLPEAWELVEKAPA